MARSETAITTVMAGLPEILRKTLAWDLGTEMTNHAQIADATGLDICFCDPHSPWQRRTNENTYWYKMAGPERLRREPLARRARSARSPTWRRRPSRSRTRVSAMARPPSRLVLIAPWVSLGVVRLHSRQPGVDLAGPESELAADADAAGATTLGGFEP